MSLAIPDPATVDLDRARDLAAAVVAWAEECDDQNRASGDGCHMARIMTGGDRSHEKPALLISVISRPRIRPSLS